MALAATFALAGCDSSDATTVTVTETASAQTDAVGIPKPQTASTKEPGAVDHSKPQLAFSAGDDVKPAVFFDQASPSAPATTTVTFRTDQILSFQQVSGDTRWIQSAMNRIQNGVWAFSSDGRAAYDTVDVSRPLYPLYGAFQGDGQHTTFRVSGSDQQGYSGFVTAEMDGSLDTSVSPPTLSFTYSASSVTASSVGGIGQGAGGGNVYQGHVTLRQG